MCGRGLLQERGTLDTGIVILARLGGQTQAAECGGLLFCPALADTRVGMPAPPDLIGHTSRPPAACWCSADTARGTLVRTDSTGEADPFAGQAVLRHEVHLAVARDRHTQPDIAFVRRSFPSSTRFTRCPSHLGSTHLVTSWVDEHGLLNWCHLQCYNLST